MDGEGRVAPDDVAARIAAVKRSVEMKADIVVRDETEQGDRALLNLGHTFCHALEAATGYSDRLLHGEGVAIGCALAFELSARMGLCSQEDSCGLRGNWQRISLAVAQALREVSLAEMSAPPGTRVNPLQITTLNSA